MTEARERHIVFFLFAASGAASLASELVWMRLFAGAVGSGHTAAALVLAVFMSGLALGAALLGKRIDRMSSPLGAYGKLELGIGLSTLVMPGVVALSPGALAVLFLLVPTTLMGATLPAIVRELGHEHPASTAGRAYALNVLGAVAGVLAAGLVLVPALGLRGTNTLAGATSLSIGAVATVLARHRARSADRAEAIAPGRALVAAGLAGASALALEVVWLRALSILTTDTVFAQTTTLAGYLLGLALGGHLAARRVERIRNTWPHFALCQLAIAAYALGSPVLLHFVGAQFGWRSGAGGTLAQLAIALGFFVVPAALSGASLAFLFRVVLRDARGLAARTGGLYAANALGATLGALGAGLLAIPRFGSRNTLLAAAVLSVAAAALTKRTKHAKRVQAAGSLALGVVVALGVWTLRSDRFRLFGPTPPGATIVFAEEDAYGLVEVRREPSGELVLVTDRKNAWGSTHPLMVESMREQGRLPLALHPAPRSIIEIGLGTGATLSPVLADARVERVEMVEISPAVARAAELFAKLDHPKLSMRIADGRHHLRTTDSKYDVIVLGLFTPDRAGAGYLFSRDLYREASARLNPGGILVHWLPLDQLSPAALASVAATFADAFPQAHAFDRIHYLALVGSTEPLSPIPESVAPSYLFDRAGLVELAAGAPLSTDDRPTVELAAARSGTRTRTLALENLERVLALRRPPGNAEKAWLGREKLIRGGMAQARGDHARAKQLFAEALELNPSDALARAQLDAYR